MKKLGLAILGLVLFAAGYQVGTWRQQILTSPPRPSAFVEYSQILWRVGEAIPTTWPRGGKGDYNFLSAKNVDSKGADVLLYEFTTKKKCLGRVDFRDGSPDTFELFDCYDREPHGW